MLHKVKTLGKYWLYNKVWMFRKYTEFLQSIKLLNRKMKECNAQERKNVLSKALDVMSNPLLVKTVRGCITQCWLCIRNIVKWVSNTAGGNRAGAIPLESTLALFNEVGGAQVYTLEQHLSNFSLSQNRLVGLLKHPSLGPTSRVSNPVRLGKRLRICI